MFSSWHQWANEVRFILLGHEPMSGRELRDRLNEGRWWWSRWSAPAFYQLMADLEKEGVVHAWYESRTIGDTPVQDRMYSLTPQPWDE